MTPRPNDRITDCRAEFAARYRDHEQAQNAIGSDYTPPGYWRPVKAARQRKADDFAMYCRAVIEFAAALLFGIATVAIFYIVFAQ